MGKGCIFKSCSELDERQLLLRGNVFQHVVVLLFGLIFLNAMLKDCGVTWAEGKGENLIIFWAGATLGLCEFILRGLNPAGRRQGVLFGFFGLSGAVLAGLSLSDVLAEGQPLLSGQMLTGTAVALIQGAAMLAIFFTYLGKTLYDRRTAAGDED